MTLFSWLWWPAILLRRVGRSGRSPSCSRRPYRLKPPSGPGQNRWPTTAGSLPNPSPPLSFRFCRCLCKLLKASGLLLRYAKYVHLRNASRRCWAGRPFPGRYCPAVHLRTPCLSPKRRLRRTGFPPFVSSGRRFALIRRCGERTE